MYVVLYMQPLLSHVTQPDQSTCSRPAYPLYYSIACSAKVLINFKAAPCFR
jgi:hypothetical protein